MATAVCGVLQGVHWVYILITYFLIPYVLGAWPLAQWVNLVNIAALMVHWKLLGERCILDVWKEQNGCGKRVMFPDAVWTNLVQIMLVSTLFIAVAAVSGHPLPLAQRLLLLAIGLGVVLVAVPFGQLFECQRFTGAK